MEVSVHRHVPEMKTAAAEVAASTVAALSSDARQETQRPACGSGDRTRSYNTGLHVFALFLILFLSILACSFPIAARRFPKLPVPHRALFLSRHFGTGVLLATAFVHLLPTAYVSLTDPCLPPFWNEGYPAMAGFIAMVSVFVVVGVEMFFASKGAGHSHGGDYSAVGADEAAPRRVNGNGGAKKRPGAVRGDSLRYFQQGTIGAESREHLTAESGKHGSDIEMSNRKRDAHGEDNGDESDLDLDELDPQSEGAQYADTSARDRGADYGHARVHSSGGLSEEAQQQKALLQCMLLEAGILFHSVFIGMAVSVATGTGFIVLLIAISFHQTFEGLALGSRIAGITAFPPGSPKPWLMALAYGTTTPLGQAIGLFVHNLYDPQSQMGLLMVGVMNAISSGLLLFAGLVELLAEDFLSDKSYETLRGARRLEACAAVVAGSMLMALVGAWA